MKLYLVVVNVLYVYRWIGIDFNGSFLGNQTHLKTIGSEKSATAQLIQSWMQQLT
jgi:hypothetical protein